MRAATEQPLEAQALEEIERSLHGKLRARRLPEDFIRQHGEDALQRGVVEYLRALERGREIRNRDAFIVDVAFKRALDELRHEVRSSEGADLDTVVPARSDAAPSTEEVALENLRLAELRQAIEALSPEQRQVLCLYFFEERSAAESGRALHLSENTFRRRLKKTLRVLRRRLGVELPEPGSLPAIEIGLAAWASIGGARVPVATGPLEQAGAALAGARDSLARLLGNGDGERVVVFGGPAGKIAGGCAGAAVACVLGGVVGPGVGGLVSGPDRPAGADRPAREQPNQDAKRTAAAEPEPSIAAAQREVPTPQPAAPSPTVQPEQRESRAERRAAARRAEARQVEAQASAAARVARESEAAPMGGASESSTEPDTVVVIPSESPSTPSQTAKEAAQAQQQFGAFK